jgi:uncharacterized protein (TIGR03437 family)
LKSCGLVGPDSLTSKALLLLWVLASSAVAQQANVSLSSASSVPGGTVSVSISLATTGGAQPAAVQWTMGYAASNVSGVSVSAGSSLTAAGKSVMCSPNSTGTICVAYGMNTSVVSNGLLATATFQIAPGILVTSVPVQMTAVSAATSSGIPIAGSGTGGIISITQPVSPAVSSLSCAPATVNAPGSATCTVALSSAALTGGFNVVLSSQNSATTVPSTISVAAGASSATFSATVSAVSSNQTATLSAAGGGSTKTFVLSIVAPQWSISGSTSAAGSGATITLTGPKNATATADGSGNFTFAGLANGAYTITPTKAGYSFSPTSRSVTLSSGNVTGVSFTAQQNTWTVSGTISPSALGAGTTLALSNGTNATSDGSGNFTFSGVTNGTYTITPAKAGYSFSPTGKSVTVNGVNVTGVTFTVTQNQTSSLIMPDVGVWRDRSTAKLTITSPSFSTKSANELLLAFVATDYISGPNTTVQSVSGAGLTWVLAVRSNRQSGTAEIWRAFASAPHSNVTVTASLSQKVAASITVMSFMGVDTSGSQGSGAIGATATSNAASGAPVAKLITTRNNSWVFGVGTDNSHATSRTPGSGQTIVHQYLATVGNTYWVQSSSARTANSGSTVPISDTAPTSDRYNLSVVEILPSTSGSGQTQQAQPMQPMLSSALSGRQIQDSVLSVAGSANPMIISNTASGLPGDACSQGGLATLFGSGFTTQAPQSASSVPVPTQLGGVQVAVNGLSAPLILVSAGQVNFQCPVLPAGSPLTITLQAEDGSVYSVQSVMEAARPGLFSMATTGQGLITIAATNEIAMPKTHGVEGRPARRGEILSIFATGLGQTLDSLPPGNAAPQDRLVRLSNTTKVEIGGVEIDPLFSGLAPGTVGLYQVNAKLPPEVPAGLAVPTVLHVILPDGTVAESNVVTVAISD